jgi:dolichol-phosphate mannosyltransferase
MIITVIIPTYNEKVNIEKMIPVLEDEIFPQIPQHTMKILIADDSSPDGTGDAVREYMKKWKNLELMEGKKEGLGAAYARAMLYAMDEMQAEAIVELDADFQHDPKDIITFIKAMDNGADAVIGSRYIPGGEIPREWGIHRKFMSIFGNIFARSVLLTPSIHDMTSGYKLTKTEYLKKVPLTKLYSKYYAYKIHILHDVVKAGARVKEVPIIFYERKEGSSKITTKDLFDSFFIVLRLRYRDSKRFVKFLIVGGTGFITQILVQEISIRSNFTYFLVTIFGGALHSQDPHALAQSIGVGFGAEAAILSNFLYNNFWTFKDTRDLKTKSPFLVRLLKFNAASLASIIIQSTAVWLGIKLFGSNLALGPLVLPTRILIVMPTIILIVIPLNYLIYNRFIWKTHHLQHEGITPI